MTPDKIKALAAPLPGDQPSGPDLEIEGDADYMRFVARIDGVLPKSFATFDRASIDFPAEFATIQALLAKTRDLRLFVFLAKLKILNRELASFVATVQSISIVLDTMWETVPPELIDGDPILRVVSLQTLDDMPDVVMPLQSTPLFEGRRFGKGSYRSHLLASGAIPPRAGADENEKGEEVPSANALSTALTECNLDELVQSRAQMLDLQGALSRIETTVSEKSGQPLAIRFEKLLPLVKEIAQFLDTAVSVRDPSLALIPADKGESAEGGEDPGGGGLTGAIRTADDARNALAAVAGYFATLEPSSPSLMLIAQAEALIGKSFFDVLQALAPDHAGSANMRVGRDVFFDLPLERLSQLAATVAEPGPAEETADESADDESGSEPPEAEPEESEPEESDAAEAEESEAQEASAENDDDDERAEESEDAGSNDDEASEPEDEEPQRAVVARPPPPGPATFRAATRKQAVAILGQIASYFRSVEPSSPVSVLLDHAASVAGRDFFGLAREILPESLFRVDE